MRAGKRILTFLLAAAALALLLVLYVNDPVTDWLNSAVTGIGNARFFELTASDDGAIWALGRQNGHYVLACGNMNGGEWRGTMNTDALPDDFLPSGIYAVSKNMALLTGFCQNEDGTTAKLQLYAITDKGKTLSALLNKDVEQGGRNVRFSTFSKHNEKVHFLIEDGDTTALYELAYRDMAVHMTGYFNCDPWNSALILSDGKIAVARDEGFIAFYSSFGNHLYDLSTNGSVSALYAGDDDFYFLDTTEQTVNEVEVMNDEYSIIQKFPAVSSLPMTVQPGGSTLWLEDGILYRFDGGSVQIDGILYRAASESILILAGCVFAILLLAFGITVLFCGKRHISLLLRAATVIAATLLICAGILRMFAAYDSPREAMRLARQGVETAASLGLKTVQEQDGEALSDEAADLIRASMEDSGFFDTRVTLYRYDNNGFYIITTTDPELESNTVVAGHGLILKAKPSGTVSELDEVLTGPVCTAVASDGPYLLSVRTNFSAVQKQGQAQADRMTLYLTVTLFAFACIIFLFLLRIWGGVYRLTAGADLVTAGEYDVELKNPSGDELEGLARSMNHLARTLKESVEKSKQINENYMRFIPEETIHLMGVERLEDVTRETVAAHEMAVITVRITIPKEKLPPAQLFSDLNMIVQRTSFAAVAYAGNSFNFGFGGYNVVFPEEFVDMSFHAAVAIREAAETINKEREIAGRPPVNVSIAIDKGLVQMGIIGDELHMVPVVASKCLIKNEQMLRLGKTLNANILFSETMLQKDMDCGFRYVGNFAMDKNTEKLYELYDSDKYLVAQRKHDTQEEFDQAIRCYYQSNFKAAKSILLHLVRTGSARDGIVCYYLNKADLYEQNPPKTLLLRGEEE